MSNKTTKPHQSLADKAKVVCFYMINEEAEADKARSTHYSKYNFFVGFKSSLMFITLKSICFIFSVMLSCCLSLLKP
jgi:hypothetical protein